MRRNASSQSEVGLISWPRLKMIRNMLPTEARFSSLDLFEKPVGPVYSPNGTMLEFAVLDLSKIFLEISCKIVQSFEADLKYDAGAAGDVNKTDSP